MCTHHTWHILRSQISLLSCLTPYLSYWCSEKENSDKVQKDDTNHLPSWIILNWCYDLEVLALSNYQMLVYSFFHFTLSVKSIGLLILKFVYYTSYLFKEKKMLFGVTICAKNCSWLSIGNWGNFHMWLIMYSHAFYLFILNSIALLYV